MSPGVISAFQSNHYYPSHEAYVDAIATAMKPEYDAIVAAGLILQLDCPDLAMARHTGFQELSEAEFLRRAEHQVEALNHAVRDIPPDRMRLHVCWGNYQGPHDCDVPLADILPVLKQAQVGALVLPFANPRHAHEYRALAALPQDQVVVAGVIDTVTNYIEHPEVVADRLEQMARVLGDPARLIAGTDCGFDTSAGRGAVAEDVVWAKLKSLSEGARLASARLGMKGA